MINKNVELPEHLKNLVNEINNNPEKLEKFNNRIKKGINYTITEISCDELFK